MSKKYQETNSITKVTESKEYYEISQGGMCCGLNKKYGVTPKVGDKLTVHTKGSAFGTIRGMDLNGVQVFYQTDEELEVERVKWLANREIEKQEAFERNVAQMDKDYESLLEPFRNRISKFRYNNPDFRKEYESYELFCCKEAVKIADFCKTPYKVKEFKDLPHEEQAKVVDDGHSGNTFGCSVSLAYWYLTESESVVNIHGALSPLVGTDNYGG